MPTRHDVVRNAPTLFHTVALVEHTKERTIANIRKMDLAQPPSLYEPARQLVHRKLSGQPYEWALTQAATIVDSGQRRCAEAVLEAGADYLKATQPIWFRPLDVEHFAVRTTLNIPVRFDGIMGLDGTPRIFCLHPWQKPLTDMQVRAALSILRLTTSRRRELRSAELDFLDLSIDENSGGRKSKALHWADFKLMTDDELDEFTTILAEAFAEYYANPAEKPAPRPRPPRDGQTDMFPSKPDE